MDHADLLSLSRLKQEAADRSDPVELHVQLESLLSKTSRSGNPYLEAKLTDASGSLIVRAWGDGPLYQPLSSHQPGTFLSVTGSWSANPPYGVEPRELTLCPLSEEQTRAMLAGPADLRDKQETDYQDIHSFVEGMRDPRLRGLGLLFLEEYGDRFRRTAAARSYHHARRGGLVEHVAQMMRSADAIAGVYPQLNRDLLLSGVLFHDCGKLWENVYLEHDFVMPHSEVGELLGHISLGMEVVNRLWRDLIAAPEASEWEELVPANDQVRLHLLHLVGSHHGEHQFGAPVLPRTPEAAALHYVDNLDAKLEMFFTGYETAAPLGKNILERVRPLPAALVRPLPSFDEPQNDDT